jgi:hypothetical protein
MCVCESMYVCTTGNRNFPLYQDPSGKYEKTVRKTCSDGINRKIPSGIAL